MNNNHNVVSNNLKSKEEEEECIFEQELEEDLEVTLKTTLNPKIERVMENLQAFCNKDSKKNVEQAKWEKAVGESSNVLLIIYNCYGNKR